MCHRAGVSPLTVTPEWTVPAPPGRVRLIRPWRVLAGTGLALLGHVPTAWLSLLVLLLRFGDRGLGAGLLAGWGVGFAITAAVAAVLATQWWATCC